MARSLNDARHGWPTVLVILTCVFGASAAGYLLFTDYWGAQHGQGGPPLGEIKIVEAQVRLKSRSSFLWDPVTAGQAVYRQDTLQSGPDSSAIVRLKGGTTVELGQNSLVVVNDLSDLSLKFLKGNFIVHGDHLAKKITIDAHGIRHDEKLPMELSSPEPGKWIFLSGKPISTFEFRWRWEAGEAGRPARLQISNSRSFPPSSGLSLPLEAAKTSMHVELPTGRYYWRIADDSGALSDTRPLFVGKAPRPLPISPVGKFAVWRDASSVPFHWTVAGVRPWEEGPLARIPHELEVAADPGFTKIVARENVDLRSGHVQVPKLLPGTYYWRVKGKYPDFVVISEKMAVEVFRGTQRLMQLILPAADSLLPSTSQRFSWDLASPPAGARYTVQIIDSNHRAVVSHQDGSLHFEWAKPNPGLYQWRVEGSLGDDVFATSDWRRVSFFEGPPIELSSPHPDQSFAYWEAPAPLRFEWKPEKIGPHQHYELDLATDRDFKVGSQMKSSDDTTATINGLAPGTYFWRVRLVDEAEHPQKLSDVRAFSVGQHAPLDAPASAEPSDRFVFKKADRSSYPEVSWAGVPEAMAYEVTVTRDDRPVLHKTVNATHLALKNLPVGQYFWTVRAVDPLRRTGGAIPARELTVDYGDPLAPPQIVTSEVK